MCRLTPCCFSCSSTPSAFRAERNMRSSFGVMITSPGLRIASSVLPARRAAPSRKRRARRLSSGDGTKGPRWHDWAYVELADLDEYDDDLAREWTRGLLVRRNIADGSLAFYSTWCPKGTSIKKLVLVEGHRWAIEDSFETTKNELGLDHNETRSRHGWHRHV